MKLQRAQFGRKSERLPDDQLQLGLEDTEAAIAKGEAEAERRDPALRQEGAKKRRANRGKLPAHLPHIEVELAPEQTSCPCCQAEMVVIGEDTSERLDVIPAQFRVLVTRRPKLACRACSGVVVQQPAPPRLIEGGLPTEAMVAHVLVARYADHLPLYRQAQMMARQGVVLDRSTLAFWVGYAAAEIAPVVTRLKEIMLSSSQLFADETVVPVLDPGRGRTKQGYFWAIARDDRPWAGRDPPAVVYSYAPGRGHEHGRALLGGYRGILQCDGYAAYKKLAGPAAAPGPKLAFCWSHVRRGFYDLAKGGNAPIATEALQRIAALYRIETDIRGLTAEERQSARQARSKPLLAELRAWFDAQMTKLFARGPTAEAIGYALNHWDGLVRFVDDGRVELGRVDDRRGGCSLPVGCRRRFRAAPSVRADMAPSPVAAHRTGHADCPHPALSRPVRPSLSAGRRADVERHRGRASRRGTRPGSGGTRCLVVPRVASTIDGLAARYRSG